MTRRQNAGVKSPSFVTNRKELPHTSTARLDSPCGVGGPVAISLSGTPRERTILYTRLVSHLPSSSSETASRVGLIVSSMTSSATGAAHWLHFALLIVIAASESGEGRSNRACPDFRQLTLTSGSSSPASNIFSTETPSALASANRRRGVYPSRRIS